MAVLLHEETKTITQKTYDRCRKIIISSVLNEDMTYTETVAQTYERVVEADGVIMNKCDKFVKEYDTNYLLPLTWTTPWGKELTGLDVMAFIKYFNDNYETMIAAAYTSASS